jgi:hypothetical protein
MQSIVWKLLHHLALGGQGLKSDNIKIFFRIHFGEFGGSLD